MFRLGIPGDGPLDDQTSGNRGATPETVSALGFFVGNGYDWKSKNITLDSLDTDVTTSYKEQHD